MALNGKGVVLTDLHKESYEPEPNFNFPINPDYSSIGKVEMTTKEFLSRTGFEEQEKWTKVGCARIFKDTKTNKEYWYTIFSDSGEEEVGFNDNLKLHGLIDIILID